MSRDDVSLISQGIPMHPLTAFLIACVIVLVIAAVVDKIRGIW